MMLLEVSDTFVIMPDDPVCEVIEVLANQMRNRRNKSILIR